MSSSLSQAIPWFLRPDLESLPMSESRLPYGVPFKVSCADFFLCVRSLPATGRTGHPDSISRASLCVGLVHRPVLVLLLSFSTLETFFG
jgi:hypothetical protein